jgi:hypothetical protein
MKSRALSTVAGFGKLTHTNTVAGDAPHPESDITVFAKSTATAAQLYGLAQSANNALAKQHDYNRVTFELVYQGFLVGTSLAAQGDEVLVKASKIPHVIGGAVYQNGEFV